MPHSGEANWNGAYLALSRLSFDTCFSNTTDLRSN
jgi:hypothetical protein